MSDLDQRLLDGIKLTTDAYDAGRLDALGEVRKLLAESLKACDGVLDGGRDPVERTRARGARDEIERILGEIEAQVARVEAKRGT